MGNDDLSDEIANYKETVKILITEMSNQIPAFLELGEQIIGAIGWIISEVKQFTRDILDGIKSALGKFDSILSLLEYYITFPNFKIVKFV